MVSDTRATYTSYDLDGASYTWQGYSFVFNTAPTTPATISVPPTIKAGTPIGISWSTSSDAEGNLAGYHLQYSSNNGQSWADLTRTTATSFTHTFNKNQFNTLGYRVAAYDSMNAYSGYRASSHFSVINNTAPTVPGGITVSGPVKGGANVTVNWTASTDEDGNLAGYKLERMYNNDGNWQQCAQVNTLSSLQLIEKGKSNVTFRVRAYDTPGLHSGYRTGTTVAIINNSAPTAPSSITVPDNIKGGSSITVSWGAATDPDGNLAGYILQRSVNGGGWEQVLRANQLSFNQTVTFGWNTIRFQVKAYDAENLESGWTVSPVRTIFNNTTPTISGADQNLGDLAVAPLYTYTITDPDPGQTLTVTETLTNGASPIQLRSYQAVSGAQNTADLSGIWLRLLSGAHQLIIHVQDGAGGQATRTVSFDRLVGRIACSRAFETGTPVRKCMISLFPADLPDDAFSLLEVCNNPFDDTPVWEQYHNPGKQVHIFANADVQTPGLALRRSINRAGGGLAFAQAVVHYAAADTPSGAATTAAAPAEIGLRRLVHRLLGDG